MTGRPRKRHELDSIIEPWVKVRRQVLGVNAPRLAAEYVGALKSTLGAVREEQTAAGTRGGSSEQRWPEVYVGSALDVHRAFVRLREPHRVAIDVWYVLPGKVTAKCDELGFNERDFREMLSEARGALMTLLESGVSAESFAHEFPRKVVVAR